MLFYKHSNFSLKLFYKFSKTPFFSTIKKYFLPHRNKKGREGRCTLNYRTTPFAALSAPLASCLFLFNGLCQPLDAFIQIAQLGLDPNQQKSCDGHWKTIVAHRCKKFRHPLTSFALCSRYSCKLRDARCNGISKCLDLRCRQISASWYTAPTAPGSFPRQCPPLITIRIKISSSYGYMYEAQLFTTTMPNAQCIEAAFFIKASKAIYYTIPQIYYPCYIMCNVVYLSSSLLSAKRILLALLQ